MKGWRILLFLAVVIAMLAGICYFFPKNHVHIGTLNLRFPTLSKVLNPQQKLDVEAYLRQQDSLAASLDSLQDSMASYRQILDSSDIRFWFPNDDDRFFDTLFAQLEQTGKTGRTIRIVHYGDSQIEMDRMSDRLRSRLQTIFGGGGPGLVPFSTLIPSYSVSTYGFGSLVRQSPYGDSLVVRAGGNYGPMVQDFHVAGSATSNIKATTHRNRDNRLTRFGRIRLLFCNRPGPLQATLTAGGYSYEQTDTTDGVHLFDWRLDSTVSEVRIAVQGAADLYGVMVDNGPGVAVDNIPMRGCSGHQFTQINRDQLSQAYSLMDVGLIIMQFGGNSVPYLSNQRAIEAYGREMGKQIDRLHQCCPRALILFIGPSDMSKRTEEGDLHSYPWIPEVVEGLRRTVCAHGAAYWSIYDAMGGANSMGAWVDQGLGSGDYIHFSQRGADVMGDRLAKAFENMYRLYKMRSQVSAGITEQEVSHAE
jgi:lysophospholipase L1-like esterase